MGAHGCSCVDAYGGEGTSCGSVTFPSTGQLPSASAGDERLRQNSGCASAAEARRGLGVT
eukprot:389487-Prymnesium_polylepis.1